MTLHNRRSVRSLAIAAVVGAIAAPTASAIPAEQFRPGQRAASTDQAVPVRVVQVGGDHGFDWGDAGLGATGLLALIAIGAGAAVAGGYRLGRHDPHPAR